MTMDTMAAVAAKKLSKLVADDFREIFGSSHDDLAERVGGLARITIEYLGRSDALYHNFEHTVLVTTVGRDILLGRTLSERLEPEDYSHLIVACLLHDIGFVRGVLSGDTSSEFVIDRSGKTVKLPRGASDASLAAYHVDRSKLFVYERLGDSTFVDAARVADAIELTRFPAAPQRRRQSESRAAAGSGRRSHRTAWRPALSEEGQRALLRTRGNRQQPPARLRIPCRPGAEVPWVLLELRVDVYRGRDEISGPDRIGPAVDREPSQSCVLRGKIQVADGSADVTGPRAFAVAISCSTKNENHSLRTAARAGSKQR